MNKPLVYISLLNWQKYEDCIQCVQELAKLDYDNFKILIRDNDSKNNSVNELKKALPNTEIYTNYENNGYAAGHLENYKIAKKEGADFFWILNCDLQVFPDTLSQLLEVAEQESNSILGSISLMEQNNSLIDFGGGNIEGTQQNPISYNTWKEKEYETYQNLFPSHREVQSVEGSSMFIPINVIEDNGFMKTDFFMYGEETDYCLSMKKKGIKSLLVTNSRIVHYGASSFKSETDLSFLPAYYRRRNYLRIMKEHFGWNNWKILNYGSSIFSKLKFLAKYLLITNFKQKNKNLYYLVLANFHSVFNIKGKTLYPEKNNNE